MSEAAAARLPGAVLVVGAGLLGTSVGLALRRYDVPVLLADVSEEHVRTASGLGAGRPLAPEDDPALVVVAVPPDHVGTTVARWLRDSEAVVTDVASVKTSPLAEVLDAVPAEAAARYVGSHPMAGSERSGPLAASAALFEGRPWAVTPHSASDPAAVTAVTALVEACGATPLTFTPEEHDRAVAHTSHLPHLLAVLVAARLAETPSAHLSLSGQGVRDVTRVAGGDPALWQQIVDANGSAVHAVLSEVRRDLDVLLAAIATGSRDAVADLLRRGVEGTRVIPGKHGGPARPMAELYVVVPDRPGELARLFSDVGQIGVNVEDLRIDHDPGRPVGLVELSVALEEADHLLDALDARGWTAHR